MEFQFEIDPDLWKKIKPPSGGETIWGRRENELVVAPDGSFDIFRGGTAVLKVPPGADIEAHLKEAGLHKIPQPKLEIKILNPEIKKIIEVRKKERRSKEIIKNEWILVKLDLSTVDISHLSKYMKDQKQFQGTNRFSSERGIKTITAIAEHRLKFGHKGFGLVFDTVVFPHQGALVRSTTEGSTDPDPMDDWQWTLTHLPEAWQLSQVAAIKKTPVFLAIVDDGFATTATELSPDLIIFAEGDSIGDAGEKDYHGTKVTSVAVAPLNDTIGGAGTSMFSAGSSNIERLISGGTTRLFWAEIWDWGASNIGDLFTFAVDNGADLINFSGGGLCSTWCERFGEFNGENALWDALDYVDMNGVPTIVSAGNEGENAGSFGPCNYEIMIMTEEGGDPNIDISVCVGSVNDAGTRSSFSNYGHDVDIFAPGEGLIVGPVPTNANPQTFRGTSAAAPYVSGVVAMAIALRGSGFTNEELKAAIQRSTLRSSDSTVSGIFDAYAFLRSQATVAFDDREPNYDHWTVYFGVPKIENDELLSLAWRVPGPDQSMVPAVDVDWLPFDNIPECGSLQFDIDFLADPSLGYLWTSAEWNARKEITYLNEYTHQHKFDYLRTFDTGRFLISVNASSKEYTIPYSITNIITTANPNPREGATWTNTCDGFDNDCDGEIDEGFTDTDNDGIADCVDLDDDNDCVLDNEDNCPKVSNASQYCSEANSTENTCGINCYEFSEDPGDYKGIAVALKDCFKNTPIDPQCFIDGCPFPGIFIDPEVSFVIGSAIEILKSSWLSEEPLHPEISKELAILNEIRILENGHIILPKELKPDLPFMPAFTLSTRTMAYQPIDACKPITLYEGIVQGSKIAQCRKRAEQNCQKDSDGDGIGDACDN